MQPKIFCTVWKRGRSLLEERNTEASFETDKMMRRFHKSCMNKTEIEISGVKPLLNSLQETGGWPVLGKESYEDFKWYERTISAWKAGFVLYPILNFGFIPDFKNNSYQVLTFDQPQLGLERQFLIQGLEHNFVKAYYEYMVDSALLLGAEEAKARKELKESLMFEILLANISTALEERRDENLLYNPHILKEFDEPPHKVNEPAHPISWQKFLQQLISIALDYTEVPGAKKITIEDNERVILRDPSYFKKMGEVVVDTDPKVIANYMGWREVKSKIWHLNDAAKGIIQKFKKARYGKITRDPLWKDCVLDLGFQVKGGVETMAAAAGSLYVRTYFKPEVKERMQEMVSYIRNSFENNLRNIDWMDDNTKAEAIKKIEKMEEYIGYPNEMLSKEKVDDLHKGLYFLRLCATLIR